MGRSANMIWKADALFLSRNIFLDSHYSIAISLGRLLSLVQPIQTFTDMFTAANHQYSIDLKNVPSTATSQDTLLCGTYSRDYASPISTWLNIASLGSTVIYTTYLQKNSLITSYYYIPKTTSFSRPLVRVILEELFDKPWRYKDE